MTARDRRERPDSIEERFNSMMGTLRILWLPGHDWTERQVESSLGAGSLGIPLNRDGGPDFASYGKQLGRKRLRTLGDMDFVLLAMWTKTVRGVLQTPVTNFAEARRRSRTVVGVALEIPPLPSVCSRRWRKSSLASRPCRRVASFIRHKIPA